METDKVCLFYTTFSLFLLERIKKRLLWSLPNYFLSRELTVNKQKVAKANKRTSPSHMIYHWCFHCTDRPTYSFTATNDLSMTINIKNAISNFVKKVCSAFWLMWHSVNCGSGSGLHNLRYSIYHWEVVGCYSCSYACRIQAWWDQLRGKKVTCSVHNHFILRDGRNVKLQYLQGINLYRCNGGNNCVIS